MEMRQLSLVILLILTTPACAQTSEGQSGGVAGAIVAGVATLLMIALPVLMLTIPILVWALFVIVILAVGITVTIFWIMMLIDCAQRQFPKENDKIVWILVIALTHWLGALIYYVIIKRELDKKAEEARAAT